MERWQTQILARVTSEETLALARRTAEGIPEMRGTMSEEDVRQLLRGFCQMLEESMDQTGDATRRFFLETAVPGLVASGQEPATLVRSTVTFAVLLTAATLEDLDPGDRGPAAEWLATFFGAYVHDVLGAATEAQSAHGG